MIRWKFLLTRLLIVAGVLMLLRWGLGPVARYVSQRAIEAATGARADIAEAEIGLFPPRLRFADVRVADPRTGKSDRDAWRADSIELEIDGDALLRRRWVARRGRISGLQIGSRRDTSGHFKPPPDADIEKSPATSSMLSQLVRGGVDGLDAQASALVDELETVRRSRAIREKWESEFETLASRGKQLERQIRELRDQAKSVDNPLRDLPQFERALTRANEVRGELTAVKQKIDSLPERFRADLASLEEAKRIDLERVDRYVPGDLSEGGEFGVEVVRAAVRQRLEQFRGYLERGRELAGYTVVSPQADRVRGETFDLLGENRPPQVLVRHCEVSGLMRSGGRTYAVSGVVENLTPSPQRLREPTRARLLVESAGPEGPEVIRAEYVRDRRQGNRVDRLTLLWPQSEGHPMRLGGWRRGDHRPRRKTRTMGPTRASGGRNQRPLREQTDRARRAAADRPPLRPDTGRDGARRESRRRRPDRSRRAVRRNLGRPRPQARNQPGTHRPGRDSRGDRSPGPRHPSAARGAGERNPRPRDPRAGTVAGQPPRGDTLAHRRHERVGRGDVRQSHPRDRLTRRLSRQTPIRPRRHPLARCYA